MRLISLLILAAFYLPSVAAPQAIPKWHCDPPLYASVWYDDHTLARRLPCSMD